MEVSRCSKTTTKGTQCKNLAKQDGLCTFHWNRAKKSGDVVQVVKPVITITFGDVAENHVGMQKLGVMAQKGFHMSDLAQAMAAFEAAGCKTELVDLLDALPVELRDPQYEAKVLIVRGGVDLLLRGIGDKSALLAEHTALSWDTKAWSVRRKCVQNKHARHNLCYAEQAQAADFEHGKGTVIAYDSVPLLKHIREQLPKFLGESAHGLNAEGNLYFDPSKCGIGFHGDAERRKVCALRLGGTMSLHYQWFHQSNSVGETVKLTLHDGDMYVMSEKAVGTDWRRKKIPTLRHAAGCAKYLQLKR